MDPAALTAPYAKMAAFLNTKEDDLAELDEPQLEEQPNDDGDSSIHPDAASLAANAIERAVKVDAWRTAIAKAHGSMADAEASANGEGLSALSLAANQLLEEQNDGFEVIIPQPSACADGSCGARQYDEDGKLIELKYKPIYKDLFGGEFKREWLADGFAAAFEERSHGARASAIKSLLKPEIEGRVYSFEMLKEEFCVMLLNELQHYEVSGLPVQRPNSMNNCMRARSSSTTTSAIPLSHLHTFLSTDGVIVNQIGMRPLLDDLQARYIQPLSKLLFPVEGAQFTSHHSFMVQYREDEDLGLVSKQARTAAHSRARTAPLTLPNTTSLSHTGHAPR